MSKQTSKSKPDSSRVVTTHSDDTRSVNFREAVKRQIDSGKFDKYKVVHVPSGFTIDDFRSYRQHEYASR